MGVGGAFIASQSSLHTAVGVPVSSFPETDISHATELN